jgi:dTDP-4-dehydrorhamnose reductase
LKVESRSSRPGLELWGGVECTVNRVGDEYFEQLERSGHTRRLSDFEQFAALGVKALRHGVLWEQVYRDGTPGPDWHWADASLAKLQELGIRPIVGLVHHGSGLRYTNLLDPEFPDHVAEYAAEVARRYPWVQDYTPVNEPLTTARFSCLYGHWYPHAADDRSFVRALLNQCRAIVLSMRAIRHVNSSARLVQTDDLGKIFSTPLLRYQAAFENERRWASFDLLCGRLNRNHALWRYFLDSGAHVTELEWFINNPCPPQVLGINHYLSGERYLDEHLERYPEHTHGGNGKHRYADVLAARVRSAGPAGPEGLLREAWERYRIPIAVTECHNGCTREEQLRWFLEVWRGAEGARQNGAQVVAVTAWSLLGAFDWNHLVTRKDGHYEPGVYDIRSSSPRPTALARVIRELGSGGVPNDPVLKIPGWWKRDQRLIYGFQLNDSGESHPASFEDNNVVYGFRPGVRPVVISGGRGMLARAFARICNERAIPYRILTRKELDIANRTSVRRVLVETQPWAVINTAGYVRVDEAECDWLRCYRENTLGPEILAQECAARNIQLLSFSSNMVFGGDRSTPYVETDGVYPLNVYGESQAKAEELVLSSWPEALLIRSSALFGPWDDNNFVSTALRTLWAGTKFRVAEDATVSPTYIPDLVHGCLDLLIDNESGIWHVANDGETSWAGLAETAADYAKISVSHLERCEMRDLPWVARRPRYSALSSQRALILPALDCALRRFVAENEIPWSARVCEDDQIAA